MEVAAVVLKVAVALLATLALVVGGALLARRLGVPGTRANQVIRVLSAASLGSRERLLLVEVHGRQMLLGVTAQQVTPLHVFGDDTPAVPAQTIHFRDTLRGLMVKSP